MPHSSQASIQTLIKPWKHLTVSTQNITRCLLAICILALFTFYYFSPAFPVSTWRSYCTECDQHLSIRISTPARPEEKTNISHILFGMGGSAKTWILRRHYSELWWQPNVTRGFVWLDQKPSKWLQYLRPVISPDYKVSADTARFKYTCRDGPRSAVRIARIVKESFELGLENVRWFVMGDDDTVFFTENLVNVLSKYDHEQMYYIGSNSESVQQNMLHSYRMAYGGAGFAISYPLAAELVRILDGCINRYAEFYGSDQKIGECMNEIGVPLTKELGFHQLDIRGNASSLLSTHPLAPLVSLHHLDYVEPLFPDMNRFDSVRKLMSAYKSDPSRALQQSFCYDLTRNWSISVSWGYAVQLYPFLVRPDELNTPFQTFITYAKANGPFMFNTRAFKPDPCKMPIDFYFDGVEKFGDGSTLTLYNRLELDDHDDKHKKKCATKTVVRNKQVTRISNSKSNVVNIRIRGFNQRESEGMRRDYGELPIPLQLVF
ncbi:beta-1 3-n-acetylglucosaminyltransferase lunatic fringe [Phtheirospermum japonicum]|uniref:Beta-1 3-n-acetylglucosaminyltransferase lunatic fringe n=1 Tax=Phtheirospermum japonicum TaxID=374723 RepID=A0A830D7A1_9LAMI|nr:beta-1 3-n-acetylglucosaminyltransferase lunatic fringe [Phtheirospermum japonicum]